MHEFVNSDGLSALISVGQDADQNYQNYILRGKQITWSLIALIVIYVLHQFVVLLMKYSHCSH